MRKAPVYVKLQIILFLKIVCVLTTLLQPGKVMLPDTDYEEGCIAVTDR